MAEMKTLLLYQDYREHFELLTDAELRQLVMAIFDYNIGIETKLEGMAAMAFSFIRAQMDRDHEKYDRKAARSRENGSKGGRPKKQDNTDNNKPSGFINNLENPDEPRKPDTDTDTDTVTDIKDKKIVQDELELHANAKASTCASDPCVSGDDPASIRASDPAPTQKQANTLFDKIWLLYPVKRGKGAVSDAQKKRLAKVGYDELARCIERYKKDVAAADFDLQYKNGSTFFNSGYLDYLDDVYAPRDPLPTRRGEVTNRHFNAGGARDLSYLEE